MSVMFLSLSLLGVLIFSIMESRRLEEQHDLLLRHGRVGVEERLHPHERKLYGVR
jgi:hypothetical protein